MSLTPSDDSRKEIMERYNKNPKGWYVFNGRDSKGFTNTIVIRGREIWIMKDEMINPYKSIGLGIKDELPDSFPDLDLHSFGYRPLTDDFAKNIMRSQGDKKRIDSTLNQALQSDPLSLDKLKDNIVLQGPIIRSPKTSDLLSKSQQSLDNTLTQQLDNLISRKYPHLRSIYG